MLSHKKFVLEYCVYFELVTSSKSELEITAYDLRRQHLVCFRWKCRTIIEDVVTCYQLLWCTSQNTSTWVP